MAKVLLAAERVHTLERELESAREELRAAVREARATGETVSELARRLNLSRARVQQYLRDA